MRRKTVKAAFVVLLSGCLLQFGCLSGGFVRRVLVEVAAEQVAGFVPVPQVSPLSPAGAGG